MSGIECPYCGAANKVEPDGEYGTAEDQAHETECDACGKAFVFTCLISFNYQPRKADCLNGSPHQFSEWQTIAETMGGGHYQRRACKDCGLDQRRTIPKKDGGEA